jgi:hypothetical protein
MIIRIATEGQYEVKGMALAKLDELDNEILAAIAAGKPTEFSQALEAVLAHIRAEGTRLPDSELKESDLILPPPDISFEEARELFANYPQDLL